MLGREVRFLEVLMVAVGVNSQVGLWVVAAGTDCPADLLVMVVVVVAAEGNFQVVLMIVGEGIEEALLQEVEVNLVGDQTALGEWSLLVVEGPVLLGVEHWA